MPALCPRSPHRAADIDRAGRLKGDLTRLLGHRLFMDLADIGPGLDKVFEATEIGSVWGIGRRIAGKHNEGGIRAVLDLVKADVITLRKQFSVVLEKTLLELRGMSCLDVDDEPAAQQQIMCSRSFGAPVTDLPGLTEVVSQFATRVAEKARHHQANAGVMIVDFRPQGEMQGELDLYSTENMTYGTVPAREPSRLMGTVDALNRRFGRGAVGVASAVHQIGSKTHMGRQERRSPATRHGLPRLQS